MDKKKEEFLRALPRILRNRELVDGGLLKECSIVEVLQALKGYYLCPKDANGKRLGPLVGYNAQYAPGLHWVGDAYLNFAELEQYPPLTYHFANQLHNRIREWRKEAGVFLGAPEGGKSVAEMLALVSGARYVYPEKEILKLKTATEREEALWKWGRHQGHINKGDRVCIGEDLFNNFATTKLLAKLVWLCEAEVVCLAGWYNRSPKYQRLYPYDDCDNSFLVITLDGQELDQYQQDDPFVAEDVAAGNLVLKAKHAWPRLEASMAQAAK